MVIMNLLRMLVDVSFYGAFAGLIARACGGSGAILGMMLQGLCYGLSRLGGGRRMLRMTLLLPMLLGWVIHRSSLADCIFLVPTAAYIIWLVWRDDYALDGERQRSLFDVFWKVLAAVLIFGTLLGGAKALTAVTVPYGLVVLVGSVLLMRALRHDPKVYCGTRYQMVNLSAIAVVAAIAGLLSTKAFLRGCAAVIKTVYSTLIQPILEFLLNVLLYIIGGIAALFSWLSLGNRRLEEQEPPQIDLSGAENIFGDDITVKEPSELLRTLGIIFLVAAAVMVLILFFRWVGRHSDVSVVQIAAREERESLGTPPRTVRKKETAPARKIRAQYRAFLKWCSETGVRLERNSTSLDIHRQVELLSGHGTVSEQIRELYIRARYARIADQDSVRTMKQLCDQVKKTDAKS